MKKLWFKRRLYGWGWTPATWEGWTVLAIHLVLVVFLAFRVDAEASFGEIAWNFLLPVAFLTAALIGISYRMGERPHWQWGKRIEDTE